MSSRIGTLGEGPLHAGLKEWYRRDGDQAEVPVDGYQVDLVRGDLLIEIQTSSFAKVRRKLRDLLERHRVRLVHPILGQRWIVRGDTRRKSPKELGFAELFHELVAFPELVAHERFSLEAWLVRAEEVRSTEIHGRRRWRVLERRLLEPYAGLAVEGPSDLLQILPDTLQEPFDTRELAIALGVQRHLAQRAAYCLCRSGALETAGKRGNAVLYRRAATSPAGWCSGGRSGP